MPKYEIGQTVIMTNSHGRPGRSEGVVTNVARKYVTVGTGYSARKFDKETGAEPMGGYMGGSIYSIEEWAERERKAAARARLKDLGLEPSGYGNVDRYSPDTIEAVVALLEAANSAPSPH